MWMIEILLFTFTFVATVSWAAGVIGVLVGNKVNMPIPLLYHFGGAYTNCYISTPLHDVPSVLLGRLLWAICLGEHYDQQSKDEGLIFIHQLSKQPTERKK